LGNRVIEQFSRSSSSPGSTGGSSSTRYYFGRRLSSFTADDADQAALLAGIAKSPREYAPTASDRGPILRRRNQVLALMAGQGFISRDHSLGVQTPLQRYATTALGASEVNLLDQGIE
jgi:membrane peptidoglycan carboxypeptidase